MRSWNIFNGLEDLQREFDNIFGLRYMDASQLGLYPGHFPQMSIREDVDSYYVEAVIPGIDAKELDISVAGNTLTLTGERVGMDESKVTSWHRRERGMGKFTRTIELPLEVDSKQARAEYRDGIVSITLTKAENAKPAHVPIKAH